MAWRNQGITGSNNIPLGKRRFGGEEEDSRTATPSSAAGEYRGRSPVRADPPADGVKRRKKRNRWGDAQENKAAGLMGLPTMIMANFTTEQLEAYTLHLRIEEISQKLRINDVVPADGDRSPSPPPQYDNFGRRVNTREYRYRKRLEDERHKLVEKAMKTIPNYHPPSDYRRPTKTQEKVYVPVNDYPEINFIGLLIGPRGNTLKKMETESGAKIAIRGKGSVKEGKGRSDAAHASNQEEDLHCLIMADTEEKVNKAKKLVHNVIETVSSYSRKYLSSELNVDRLPLFPKVRTSSRGTSFVSLLRLTVLSVTMRTKLARTVVKSDTASTTVLSSATLPPTSSVVSVATPDTWLVIVLIASAAATGATTEASTAVGLLTVAMLSTGKWSNSCKNCLVVLLDLTASPCAVLKAAPKVTVETT
ncbi:putative zinc knuckle transcription factor/splicing factor MSL5/ZFM1 [Aspergillus stella-maris]|uniref:putative zinc knuckle transcription factor/splicing factor MSL5/ZFM1 n=1 Tax=Aspergillus stella-maris TaxID=1810926 RepID=UPI003CCD8DB2